MSKVFFTDLRANATMNLQRKLEILMKKAGIDAIDFNRKMTAVKIHFGEPGNLSYIRPNYASTVVKYITAKGGKPFLTDGNTLYTGRRSNAVDHLRSAWENGFNPLVVDCPVIIADGLKGLDYVEVPVNKQYCRTAKIGRAVTDADILVSMNHFKGHEFAGFGGALKNLGMGCASIGGKLELHSSSAPKIVGENCTGCKVCVRNCAQAAITVGADNIADINYEKCVGCGQCVAVCQYEAAQAVWNSASEVMNCKIAEYTLAVTKDKPCFHISFIIQVSPDCDCWGFNDYPLVPDIGIAASFDPVALDQACVDMVIKAPLMAGSRIYKDDMHNHYMGKDKFALTHPNVHWVAGLIHAEEIGLGTRKYELVTVGGR
jgi:uncharacterized protein